jgi:hypothetical protein
MKKALYSLSIILALLTFSVNVIAQEITMYHMHNLQQKHQINPAMWGDCRVFVGLPGISSVQLGFENRGFEFLDITDNFTNLSDILKDHNQFVFDVGIDLLAFGFKAGKTHISFNFSQKNSFKYSLPKDFLLFLRHGNESFIGETADLSGVDFGALMYTEMAIGFSREITEKLTIGARAKLLNGLADMSVEHWDAGLFTGPVTYELDMNADIQMNTAAPLDVYYNDDDPQKIDSIKMQDIKREELLGRYLLNNPNRGFGFDFGAVYSLSDKITLSASVTDFLSQITWTEDVYNLKLKGDYQFEGMSLNSLLSDDFEEEDFEVLQDSILSAFAISGTKNSYTSKIGTSYYLGGSYDVLGWLNVGGLVRGKLYKDIHLASYSLSANAKAGRFLSGSVSCTMLGSGDFNLGVGLGLKLGPAQLYLLADNIAGINYDPALNVPWPGSTQNLDFRFGINLLFGCRDKE